MDAAKIITELKGSPPEVFAEISAFMLQVEREDPARQAAMKRKQSSSTGQVVSRPYEQAQAAVRAALERGRCE